MCPVLKLENINKTFLTDGGKESLTVLENINLEVTENEFVCIIGPSGCGKSTLLRIISGLEEATDGSVLYRGKPHNKPRREIGVVFQNYSLMPWLNVADNIALGLKFRKAPAKDIEAVVNRYLKITGLEKFRKAYPHELSGGMQQRVAIARTLANDPDVVLMDEPFGALDAYTRIVLQKELLRIWEDNKKTILFVTHSVDEAVFLADRIILMSRDKGKIVRDSKITLSRPRDRSDPEYVRLMNELLNELETINNM